MEIADIVKALVGVGIVLGVVVAFVVYMQGEKRDTEARLRRIKKEMRGNKDTPERF